MSSSNRHRRIQPWQPKRCDARVKNPVKIGRNGVRVARSPFCRAWAMPNGRCRVHGGASTGPRTPEGKARVVAAMVAGRRAWAERQCVEGRKFPAGRKRGAEWLTEPMRERARAEARRLGARRFTLDRPLTLALLKSAKGDRVWEAKAKAMLDANEQGEADRDIGQALSVVRDLRARAIAGWSGGAPLPPTLRFGEVGPNAYGPARYAPDELGSDPNSCRQVAAESLRRARPHRENIDGESPGRLCAGQASRPRSRYGDN